MLEADADASVPNPESPASHNGVGVGAYWADIFEKRSW